MTSPSKLNKPKILFCVLNWGLGHATRSTPIIQQLTNCGFDVQIASDGSSALILKKSFPQLTHWELPSYQIDYGKDFVWSMIRAIPSMLRVIEDEKKEIDQIVQKVKFDFIFSDNRYGCWNLQTKNIFICHQHQLLMPKFLAILAPSANFFHRKFLNKFDYHLIPDTPQHDLAGSLSKSNFKNTSYIGNLSRLTPSPLKDLKYEVMAIVSGPEPHISTFFELLKKQLSLLPYPTLLVGGMPEKEDDEKWIGQCRIVPYMNEVELSDAIGASKLIICRSGYSSIMDLVALQKKAILIPTPLQTEQEYLASFYEQKKIAFSCTQSSLNLIDAINKAQSYKGFGDILSDNDLLLSAIKNLTS
jgi:uncharacterized protein (TIGR00661 family)